MALVCPVELDTRELRTEVSKIYGRVAFHPDDNFHFHRGPAYAARLRGASCPGQPSRRSD